MKYSSLAIGRQCVLDGQYISISWPSASTSHTSIGAPEDLISLLNKQSGDNVTVQPVHGMLPTATEIKVKAK